MASTDLEEGNCGLFQSTISAFTWSDEVKTTTVFSQDGQQPGQDSKRAPSKYKRRNLRPH